MEFSIEPAQCMYIERNKEMRKILLLLLLKPQIYLLNFFKEVKFISTNSIKLCVYFVSNHHHEGLHDQVWLCLLLISRIYLPYCDTYTIYFYAIYDMMCDLSNYNWIFWGYNKDEISHEQINILFSFLCWSMDGLQWRFFVCAFF